jgi:hypothetical protein
MVLDINPHRLISAINTHLPRDEKKQRKATVYNADADSVVKRLVNSYLFSLLQILRKARSQSYTLPTRTGFEVAEPEPA